MSTGKALAALFIWGVNASLFSQLSLLPSPALRVHVFDVGQGDSILLTSPSGKHVLVDGGPDLSPIQRLTKTLPFFQRTIDLLVITHPNTDHFTAIPAILQHYTVRAALIHPLSSTLPLYQEIVAALLLRRIPILHPSPERDISLGDGVILDILWPPTDGTPLAQDPNNTSIAFRVLHGNQSVLLTGDMEEKAEMALLASGNDLHTTFLKVAHHGSKTSTSTGFLLASAPQAAVISVGGKNTYGHPHPSIVARLRHFDIPTTTTAESGTVVWEF